jgi:hypothetical protein
VGGGVNGEGGEGGSEASEVGVARRTSGARAERSVCEAEQRVVSEMIERTPLPEAVYGDQVDAVANRYMRKRMR